MDGSQSDNISQSITGNIPTTTDRVMVTYYTDPLCCWSWALERHWNKLKTIFHQHIEWRYVMGGMIQDWKSYNDPLNSVSRPLQLGPVWMHAAQLSDTPMDYTIWHKDPPASSFPSCIAVKCAALQSEKAGEMLLNTLREAVMTKGLNIAKESVLFSIADDAARVHGSLLDINKFKESWKSGAGVEAFRSDLQKTRFLKIGRYPTLTFMKQGAKGIMITGYRPYEILLDALSQILDISEISGQDKK
jgi:predicted DsbA family dithiol-disulfide isomerase